MGVGRLPTLTSVCHSIGVVWTSLLGHSYHRRPPPIFKYHRRPPPILGPLPDPIPRDRPPYPLMIPLDDGWEDTEIWEDPHPNPSRIRRANLTSALTSHRFECVTRLRYGRTKTCGLDANVACFGHGQPVVKNAGVVITAAATHVTMI